MAVVKRLPILELAGELAAVHPGELIVTVFKLLLHGLFGIVVPGAEGGGVALVDEKLAAVGIRAGVRHRNGAGEVEQLLVEFILEFAAEDAFAAGPVAFGIAALDHEVLDHAVEEQAVIIALFRMFLKILHRFGRRLREEAEGDVAL